MPSTYTTNNGLEKIGTGEQSGTWGDTTNLNFDILDQALDGLVTITATDTGSSGSPNSLPITDGTLSDGRNRLIIITDGGDLGGSVYYQLTPADAEKIVFLRNSLSGSRDLILFQGTYNSARDLIVPAGKDVVVKFSGTGTSTAVVAPVFADLSLDAATIGSADINGGTIDGVTIGVTSVATVINVDNLKLDGNTLSSTNTNGNVVLAPNGDGDVQLDADTVRVGDSNTDVTITTNGTGDLTLNTNGGTNSGSIEIQDGVNTNIIVTANGTGKLELANGDITTSASTGSDAAGTDLTIQAGASTGNAAGGDMVFQTTPAGAGSGTNLNSYTTVLTLTDDSKLKIGTSTAVSSILDEDDMSSNSATALSTQQSIKAYVDAQVGTVDTLAEVLGNGNTTGSNNIIVTAGQSITVDTISETTAANGVVIDGVTLKDGGATVTADVSFGDNDKAIFGAGSDLQIYHDGNRSYVDDTGTGSLWLRGGDVAIKSTASETMADFANNGAVQLYYDQGTYSTYKLATTSTGVDITGTLVSDGLTVDDAGIIQLTKNTTAAGDSLGIVEFHDEDGTATADAGKFQIKGVRGGDKDAPDLLFIGSDSTGVLRDRIQIEGSGDITFYDASGNASFVYDESAGSTFNENSADRDFRIETNNSSATLFVEGQYDGVGIHTSSPVSFANAQAVLFIEDNVNPSICISDTGQTNDYYIVANGSRLGFIYGVGSNTGGTVSQVDMLSLDNSSGVVFNDGALDRDFRVESDNESNMLFVDAANNRLGIRTNAPASTLHIDSDNASGTTYGIVQNDGTANTDTIAGWVIRDGSTVMGGVRRRRDGAGSPIEVGNFAADATVDLLQNNERRITLNTSSHVIVNEPGLASDFRVESDSNTHMLFVDGANNFVGIDTSNPVSPLVVSNNGASGIEFHPELATNFNRITNFNRSTSAYNELGIDALAIELRPSGVRKCSINASDMVVNQDAANYDFRVESDSVSHAIFVDANEDKVSFWASATDTQTVEGSLSAPIRIQRGLNITHTLTASGNSRDTLNLDTPGSWAASGNAGTTTSLRWSNGVGNTMGRIGLQYSGTESGGHSEFVIKDLYQDGFGASGKVAVFGSNKFSKFFGGVTINENGGDHDFRVESDTNTHMLFVDASTDRVGIGAGASPASTLHIADTTEDPYVLVDGSGANRDSGYKINAGGGVKVAIRGDLGGSLSYGNENQMTLTSGAVVFNEASADIDFRVESNGQANMLFIDGGSDTVSIAQSSGSTLGGDIRTRLYVNGAINAGALRTRGFTNPNGKVFTFPVGSNGNASFLELTCTDYLGARKTIFTCNNASGNWNVTARDVMSSGTAPTFTISGSGTAQPTITVSCNTAYSGGFLKIDQMGSIPTLA